MQERVRKEQRLPMLQEYIQRMPSLSTTMVKVIEICNNPATSTNDLARVISLDPVLTARVLRLINSAYYALANRVTSLAHAIIMLGLNTVKNLALSTAILENVGGKGSFRGLKVNDFWEHSLCVGVTSKIIAGLMGIPLTEREEYFVAGLLHDIGKIPLNTVFADEYSEVLKSAYDRKAALYLTEQEVIGIDHGTVGGIISEKWQLNQTIIDSLRHHHQHDGAGDDHSRLVMVVGAANIYANMNHIGSSGDVHPEGDSLPLLLSQIGISPSTLTDMQATVMADIEKAKVFLQVIKR